MSSLDPHIIDEYLLNRLEGPALTAFEQQMSQDKALADEVALQRQLLAAVDALGDLRMKERVQRIHKTEMERPTPNQESKKTGKWAILVVLLLLTAFGLWMVLRPKQQAPAQLYAAYYEPYDLSFGSRSTDAEQLLADAGTRYKAGNYAQALPLFEKAFANTPNDSKTRLAIGICQMEIGEFDQALTHFNALINANDPIFGEQAIWYAALAHLHKNNTEDCKKLLETLVKEPDSKYYEKAAQLLSNF